MHFKISKNSKLIQSFNQALLYEIWYLNIFTDVISGAGTANNIGVPEFTARFVWGSGVPELTTQFVVGFMLLDLLVFCVIFCRLLFALSFCPYCWPFHCLSFFDLRLLITHVVFSNCSFCFTFTEKIQY